MTAIKSVSVQGQTYYAFFFFIFCSFAVVYCPVGNVFGFHNVAEDSPDVNKIDRWTVRLSQWVIFNQFGFNQIRKRDA